MPNPARKRMNPPRVLLVGNYPPDRQQSMLRFGDLMLRELRQRGLVATLICPESHFIGNRASASGLGKWLGYADKLLRFPNLLRRAAQDHDVVHIVDHSNASYCHHLTGKPLVVTCHDLLAVRSALGEFPENHTRWSGRQLQNMVLKGLRAAPLVACVSRATQSDVQRIAGLAPERTALVANGLNHSYHPLPRSPVIAALTTLGIPSDQPYMLHVGGNHWYKNRPGVLRIMGALRRLRDHGNMQVIMIGEPLDATLTAIAQEENLTNHLHTRSNVDNDMLNALYCGATGLIFPSLHEGFGWPIIEAQAAGCPAFIANRPPLPEVAGADALHFDPLNPLLAAQAISKALSQRETLIAAGFANAAKFTTSAMIDGYIELYERARQ